MRYGVHHARSTDALAWLLVHDEPVRPEEHAVLLSCRAALLAAHRERCERTIRGADVQVALFNKRPQGRDLAVLARGGATALGIVLDEYPAFAPHAARFTDVLQHEDLSPQAHAWKEAARHAVLATEAVVTATSWTERPDQAWQVVADVADSAQALVRLDARLSASDPTPLPEWSMMLRFPAAELNLTSRHLAYVARSGQLDAHVDATSRAETHHGLHVVRDLDEVVQGAQSLARSLVATRLSVSELRMFSVMHSELAHIAAEALSGTGLDEIQTAYRQREVRFREVAGMTSRVHSLPSAGGIVALRQTQELGRVVAASVRRREPHLHGVLADLNEVYPEVTSAVARGVARAFDEGTYLVVDDDSLELAWRRTWRGERPKLSWAASQLAEAGPEQKPHVQGGVASSLDLGSVWAGQSIGGAARERLRSALATDQTFRRPNAPNRSLSRRRL